MWKNLKERRKMENEIIQISVVTSGKDSFVPNLTTYVPNTENRNKPAVLVFGGGGYKCVTQYEAAPTAEYFSERGFAAFAVHYSCLPATFPQSLCEGLWAVRYLRRNAEKFGIDPENITALGFSAGGHLAAATGLLWNIPQVKEYLGENTADCRPDKLVLCYPVLSNEGAFHRESFLNLLGQAGVNDPKLMKLTSLERHVTKETPPTFLWHGSADSFVPVEGSLRFAAALAECHVPMECHIYPFANHGGGLCRGLAQGEWAEKAWNFIKDERLSERKQG